MMPSYEFENGQLREENNALRHSRNAAQQRAEQAERERDEAIDLLMRIRAITTASLAPAPTVKADTPETAGIMPSIAAPLEWTPKTGAEIAADMEGKPAILPTDFDVNAAPDIDAIMSNLTVSLAAQDVIHASLAKDNADGYLEDGEPCRAIPYLSEAIGYLIDALKGIQKGSAS